MNARKTFKWLSFLLIVVTFSSCRKSIPSLEGFDQTLWTQDKNACNNQRKSMGDLILNQKDKLLALSETEIVDILGKPDQNELYKRNQKFYYYYLSPAPSCAGNTENSAQKLEIRFNAMGLAKEIRVINK